MESSFSKEKDFLYFPYLLEDNTRISTSDLVSLARVHRPQTATDNLFEQLTF